jgi:hypothetical protein
MIYCSHGPFINFSKSCCSQDWAAESNVDLTAEQYRTFYVFGYKANKKKKKLSFLEFISCERKKLPILFLMWKEMNKKLFRDKNWVCLHETHDGFIVQLLSLSKRERRLSWCWKFACPFYQKEDRKKCSKHSKGIGGLDAEQTC